MKTILAICLATAAFAIIPTGEASAVCDPVQGYPEACVGSYGYGTCSNGYGINGVGVSHADGSQYYWVGASTFCWGYPGWYSYRAVSAGAGHCNDSTCENVYVAWYGYNSYCATYTYVRAAGVTDIRNHGCPAGPPPAVPALLP